MQLCNVEVRNYLISVRANLISNYPLINSRPWKVVIRAEWLLFSASTIYLIIITQRPEFLLLLLQLWIKDEMKK